MADTNKEDDTQEEVKPTTDETDLSVVDFNVPAKVVLKHGLTFAMYKGEFLPTFWPRASLAPGIPEINMDWKDWFESLKDFKAREDDIYVSSYPKSGHHWMNEVVYMLQHGTTQSANISKGKYFLELRTMEELESLPSPRILLTHLSYEQLPKDIFDKGCKMFYIYRNPKDVTVSYFYHIQAWKIMYNFNGVWDDYFNMLLDGQHEYGRWLESVPAWLDKTRENPNVLIFSYEDLKKDFIKTSKRLAAHIGKSYDDDFYEKLAEACSIETMKKNDSLDIAKVMTGKPFIRKGQVGTWKNYFTVAQNERFDAIYNPIIDKYRDNFAVQFE